MLRVARASGAKRAPANRYLARRPFPDPGNQLG